MKPFFVFLAAVLIFQPFTIAQAPFENISFEAALLKAGQTGKLIFLQYESEICKQCNEVADKGFSDKKLSELLQQTFICIKITKDHSDRDRIATKYNRKEGSFGSLFIISDETLIHQYAGSATLAKKYLDEIDRALSLAGEGLRISTMDKQYKSGLKTPDFMEAYMLARKTLNLETDSLLEEYVRIIPPDSLLSKRILLFIAQMGPVLESKADQQLRKNYYNFIEAWKQQPNNIKIATNNRIVFKSMQKAIRAKDEEYAYKVADFRRRTYDGDPKGGQKAYEYEMLRYYLETNDTLNYLIRSMYYYDNNFMTISVDSIKRKDSLIIQAQLKATSNNPSDSANKTTRKIVSFTPTTQYYNRELNIAATAFYQMSNEPIYLAKAVKWAIRANEFYNHYISLNTLAKLYYKTGQKTEALKTQTKAIELKKKMGFDTKEFEKELADMQTGQK